MFAVTYVMCFNKQLLIESPVELNITVVKAILIKPLVNTNLL